MPAGLDIDRTSALNGVMAGYAEQVLVCTGRDDWPSRIEDDNGGDNLAADLKELLGRGGIYSDPHHHVSVLNASLPSSALPRAAALNASAYLLPSFKYVPFVPRVSFASAHALVKGLLLPPALHRAHDGLSPAHRDRLTRSAAHARLLPGVRDVRDAMVLVCGHGGRDARCGVVGPVLRGAFEAALEAAGVRVLRGPVEARLAEGHDGVDDDEAAAAAAAETTARVALVSHIGGHKFAGNVIVYLPPRQRLPDGRAHPLAGHGIWYGRVEPRHAEGLVAETLLRGRVVADMFRGGIDAQRRILRL